MNNNNNLPTQREIAKAKQDEQQKIKLEKALAVLLISFLNSLIPKIKSSQQIYELNNERFRLESILNRHYIRVQNVFIKRELEHLGVQLTSSQLNNLKNILQSKASIRAVQQAGRIIQTMQKQLNENGVQNLKPWIAATRKRIMSSIINTETQSVAEETKNDVLIFVINNSEKAIVNVQRKWVTVGDDRVRIWHMEANGQVRPLDEKFLVGPDYLRYPGDPVGQPENIIGCRCTLLTSIEFN